MLWILLAFVIWIPALLGWGSMLARLNPGLRPLISTENEELPGLALFGVFGMALLSVGAMAANFFMAVGPLLSAAEAGAGILLFVLNRREILRAASRRDLIPGALLLVYLSAAACRESNHGDTGIYHMQAIRWIAEYPVPLGLANLHPRLGFNSSWFAAAAALELPLLAGRACFLISGLLIFFYGLLLIGAVRSVLAGRITLANVFALLSVYPWAKTISSGHIASASPDLAVTLLTLLVTYLIVVAYEKGAHAAPVLWLAALFSVFACTVKLSALPLGVGALAIAGWNLRAAEQRGLLLRLAGVTSLFALVWFARGVCLTGTALFPSSAGCIFNFNWSMPRETVLRYENLVRSWARQPDGDIASVLNSWDWLTPWWERTLGDDQIRGVLIFGGVGVLLLVVSVFKPRRVPAAPILVPLLLAGTGIVFWFLTAPDPRFGYGFLFAFALLLCAAGVLRSGIVELQPAWRSALTAIFLCAVLARMGWLYTARTVRLLEWPAVPEAELLDVPTRSGQTFKVSKYTRAWNAPLPNTCELDPDLVMERGQNGEPIVFWIRR
jgi:hypothetical protein